MDLSLKDTTSDAGRRREAAARAMFAEKFPNDEWSELAEVVRMTYRRAITERVSPILCAQCGKDGDSHQGGHTALHRFETAPRTTAT